jgi:hypothetical protein
MDYYNGYTPSERSRKLSRLHNWFPNRSHPYYSGACHMCGDPSSPVAPHGEDYSEPYLWERPAVYAVCSTCHGRLHKRFKSPHAWEAYKRHLRRGGYGSDLKAPPVARHVSKLAKTLAAGSDLLLPALRTAPSPDAWWESLTIDPEALTASWARVR